MTTGGGTLRTARLRLRRQLEQDAVVFHQMWTERDERVPAHRQLDAHGHPNMHDIAAHIRGLDQSIPGLLTVELRETGEVIGYCGVVIDGEQDADEPELAFELLRAVHNRGYATEAGRVVVDWARAAGYRRLKATVWDWNAASRRALDKLGFRESGIVIKQGAHGRSLLTVLEL